MAILVVNKKFKPYWIKFDALEIIGLQSESHEANATIFQHPIDYNKQGLTDEIILEPRRYTASCFIADNAQSYGEQFRNWGKFLDSETFTETKSESVFKTLEKLRGVLVDIEESFTGTIKSMMITRVTGTRELQRGMRVNFDMQGVFFAESTKTEEYQSQSNTDIAKKTAKSKPKPKPKEQELTEKEINSSWFSDITGSGETASGARR